MSGFVDWLQKQADTSLGHANAVVPNVLPDPVEKLVAGAAAFPEAATRAAIVPALQAWMKVMELDQDAARNIGGRVAYQQNRLNNAGILGQALGTGLSTLSLGGALPTDAATKSHAGDKAWQEEGERVYREEGPQAYFEYAMKGHPILGFVSEAGNSPLNALGGLGAGLRGASTATRGGRAALTAGKALGGVDRVLGLPFEGALKGAGAGVRGAARVGPIGDAITHLSALSDDSKAAMEVRRLWNWLGEAQQSGSGIDDVLNSRGVTSTPGTPSGVAPLPGQRPGVQQQWMGGPTGGTAPPTSPNNQNPIERVIGPIQETATQPSLDVSSQGLKNPNLSMTPPRDTSDAAARQSLLAAGLDETEVDELMGVVPEGAPTPEVPNPTGYDVRNGRVFLGDEDVTHVGRMVANSTTHTDMRDAVVDHVMDTGDASVVLTWAEQAGLQPKNIPSVMKQLFGDVVEGQPGYAGLYNAEVPTNPAVARQMAERAIRAQSGERLNDFLTFVQAEAILKDAGRQGGAPAWAGGVVDNLEPERNRERVRGAIQSKYRGVTATPKTVYDPDNPADADVLSAPGIKRVGSLADWIGSGSTAAPEEEIVGPRLSELRKIRSASDDAPGPARAVNQARRGRQHSEDSLYRAINAASPLSGDSGGLDSLSDEAIEGLQQYKDVLLESRNLYMRDKTELQRLIQQTQLTNPGFDPSQYQNHQQLIKGMKAAIGNRQVNKTLDNLVKPWDDLGVDLLNGDAQFAMGARTAIEIAKEMAPRQLRNKSDFHKFMVNTLPSMWKEQALLSPRFLMGNASDIIFKSLMHAAKPFEAAPSLKAHADALGVVVPEETTQTAKDALVASRDEWSRGVKAGEKHVSRLRGLGSVGEKAADIREGNFGNSSWRKVPLANPIAAASEFNLGLNSLIESSARGAMWKAGSTRYLAEHAPQVVETLATAGNLDAGVTDSIRRAIAAQDNLVRPERAYEIAVAHGVDERVAKNFQKAWANLNKAASKSGVDFANHIHFDYAARNNLDTLVGKVLPFHFWASRNIPFYMEHLAENPLLAVAWMRWNRIAQEETDNKPNRMRELIPFLPGGVVNSLFGQAGEVGINPAQIMSVASQLDSTQPYTEGMPLIGKILSQISAKTGFSPGPVAEYGLGVAGAYGDNAREPSLFRHGGVIGSVTGTNPNDLVAKASNKLQGIDTKSGSSYKDYLIEQRIAELSIEKTGEANNARYLEAMNDPNSDIWKEAEADIERETGASNLLSLVTPFTTKFAGDTELGVAQAKHDLGPVYREDETEQQQAGRLQRQAANHPEQSELRDAYSAVTGDPIETELRTGMELWGRVKASTQYMPARNRGQAREQFLAQHPMLQEYFNWLGTLREGEDSSMQRFIAERK